MNGDQGRIHDLTGGGWVDGVTVQGQWIMLTWSQMFHCGCHPLVLEFLSEDAFWLNLRTTGHQESTLRM